MTSQEQAIPASPDVPYEERYTDAELDFIIEQGLIYMCACPAQVAAALRKLRSLLRYQYQCLNDPANDLPVHAAIARSTIQAHRTMQDCLDSVIALEQWDRATLLMPPGLRQRQMQALESDD